jgi:acyl transferase domain-containing protein/phosphopantetheinyl transferase
MDAPVESQPSPRDVAAPAPVAIIGMACMFPQAPDLASFWRNIMGGVDAVGEPTASWDAQRYLESGRIKTAAGGYLKDLFRFEPREFGIMPNSLDGGEPDQFLALRVARDALADAGYLEGFDHRDTGIVLGHSTYLHRGQGAILQNTLVLDQTLDLIQAMCPTLPAEALAEVRARFKAKLPPCTADIAPGLVPNVMTGRIANRLNLKGPNYLVDAACSSSLLAVNAAMDELRSGRSRLMLAGGVNASLPAEVTVIFTQLGALSGRGKVRPFEKGSDGTLLGEGLGVVVLKRLDDALADGDRIYAVLRGIGQASDGRGQGLLAPSVEGETLAIRRAYDGCGVDPASVSLIEAHGTGIPLGDRTEIAALKNVFGSRTTPQGAIALGSIKSMISHCIPAAGIAGLVKTALALHHRVLPPTLCETVNDELGIADTPLYVNTASLPWTEKLGRTRRAGIDSFGFGGINVHAVLEEAPQGAVRPASAMPWPAELCVVSAPSREALLAKLERVAGELAEPGLTLPRVAAALAAADAAEPVRLALVAKNLPSLLKNLETARRKLRDDTAERWSTRGGTVFGERSLEGGTAFIFPGEGSQYIGMLGDLALCFPAVREWLDFWHTLYDEPRGRNRTDVIFPAQSELDDAKRGALEARLHQMDVGSEAVFVAGQAMHALLRALGVEPDVMMGHSSGESSALAASGAVPADSPAALAAFVRQLNAVYERVLAEGNIATGALLAVGALPAETVEAQVAAAGGDVAVAMDNCANQKVLYGPRASIDALQKSLGDAGGICLPLPFDRGYHTPAFAAVSAAFHAFYADIGLRPPAVPLYSCAAAGPFPDSATGAQELAARQWSSCVRFRETIERMHADGVRHFIEVGPSGNLTAFVNDVLAGRERGALATNMRRRNGVEQFLTVLAELYAAGKPVAVDRLFEDRIGTQPTAARDPRALGVALDNTMPMLRLSADERTRLQGLAAATTGGTPAGSTSPSVGAAGRPAPIASPADASTRPSEAGRADDAGAAAAEPASALIDAQPVVEAVAAIDARGAVMADYFQLMRGFLAQQRDLVTAWRAPHAAPPGTRAPDAMPLLDEMCEHDAEHLVARCHLSLADNFLRSHVLSGPVSAVDPELSGLACVPLMVSLEIMAEGCAVLAATRALKAIENVRAFDWIALDDEAVTLEVHAEVVDAAGGRYRAQLMNGAAPACTAEFVFAEGLAGEPTIDGLAPLDDPQPYRWSGSELYTTGMFHGPVFQSIREIDGWNAAGIDATLAGRGLEGFRDEGLEPDLVLDPVLLDAVGQLAAYWTAQHVGTDFNSFPSTIGRIELYASCRDAQSARTLRGRQRPMQAGADDIAAPRSWSFDCVDAAGAPLFRVDGLVNVFFEVPHSFYEARRDPLLGLLGHGSAARPGEGIALWEVPHYGEAFCAQSNGIFLRILAHALLSHDERDAWRALEGSVKHRRQWLLGRAAIKEAVRVLLYERTGHLLHPSDVTVVHDAQGAPGVDGWWVGQLAAAPHVSLSHTDRASLAAAALDAPLGVDLEDLGRVQRPDLLAQALTPGERAVLEGLDGEALEERLLRVWCAKEAAAKRLGIGMLGSPERFDVRFVDDGLDRAWVDFEGAAVSVDIVRDGRSVIALAAEPSADAAVAAQGGTR